MKVRVCYTTEVDDFQRRAIGHWWGEKRQATRSELQEYFRQQGAENIEDVLSDYERSLTPEEE